jgi:hypothetical protein
MPWRGGLWQRGVAARSLEPRVPVRLQAGWEHVANWVEMGKVPNARNKLSTVSKV